MRLLLDEHFPPEVAVALRGRGHDVIGVAERSDLRGQTDTEILLAAAAEGRVVVTEDVRDYIRLGSRRLSNRRPHHGVVVVSRRSLPRSRGVYGPLIRALDALLKTRRGDDDLVDSIVWLSRPDELAVDRIA